MNENGFSFFCQISPSSGVAMNTTFDVSCSGFKPSDEELEYRIYYAEAGQGRSEASYHYLTKSRSTETTSLETQLPSGAISLKVRHTTTNLHSSTA